MRFTKKGTIEGGQGNPQFVPPAMQDQMVEYTKSFYEHFVPNPAGWDCYYALYYFLLKYICIYRTQKLSNKSQNP